MQIQKIINFINDRNTACLIPKNKSSVSEPIGEMQNSDCN